MSPVFFKKSDSDLKVLRIKNCRSIDAVFKGLEINTEQKFASWNNLFVFVLELVKEPEELEAQAINKLSRLFRDKRPMVVQVIAPNGYKACFGKSYKGLNFHDLSSQELPADVALLKEMMTTHGCFSGDILASTMGSIAENSNSHGRIAESVLCLRVTNLFEGGFNRIMPWLGADYVLSSNNLNAYFAFIDYPFEAYRAVELAWSLKKYDLVATFIEQDSYFPEDFDFNQMRPHVNDEFKNSFDLRRDLHENVASQNIVEVSRLLRKVAKTGHFKHLQKCYNEKNESLMVTCLRNFNLEIYELLLQEKLIPGELELYLLRWSLLKELPVETRKAMAKINAKFFTPIAPFRASPDEHPMMSRCWLSFGHSSEIEYSSEIDAILKHLEKTTESKQLLDFAMKCPDLKIVFDFKNDHTYSMDPSCIYGICIQRYSSKSQEYKGASFRHPPCGRFNPDTRVMTISAEPFLYTFNQSTISGILTRLLAQSAMQMLYGNNCLPFKKFDTGRQLQFDEIVSETEEICEHRQTWMECKFVRAFAFKDCGELPKELISRVPEIMVQMAESPNLFNTEEMNSKFPKLINFYSEFLVPELKSALREEGQFNP